MIRGRTLDPTEKFLPDDLTHVDELVFLSLHEQRLLGQIQARTYVNTLGLVDKVFACATLDATTTDVFRRVDALIASCIPGGYAFGASSSEVQALLSGKSTWSVHAFACAARLCWEVRSPIRIAALGSVSPLFTDMVRYLGEAATNAVDGHEVAWRREDGKLRSFAERDAVARDFQELVAGVDGILRRQADADASCFMTRIDMEPGRRRSEELQRAVHRAYRRQLIVRGSTTTRFRSILEELLSDAQAQRIQTALAALAP